MKKFDVTLEDAFMQLIENKQEKNEEEKNVEQEEPEVNEKQTVENDGFEISDIYEEDNPDGIIDKLFHIDAEPAVSVESPEVKEEHKVDPDEFALYKKYL